MRTIIMIIGIILFIGNTCGAFELGPSQPLTKGVDHVGRHPGTPDGREGGETMADAFPILELPYFDSGNTADNVDDYDVACPYPGSISPDVVYTYTPQSDVAVSVDLCGSAYDTKTYILDADGNVIACNDDYYQDTECGWYVSAIDGVTLEGGTAYFIVVDGYGGDAGDYLLEVKDLFYPHPCVDCGFAELEGEPELEDGYIDLHNSGCNDSTGLEPFQHLAGTGNEYLNFCGYSGWYDEQTRDTDWFTVTIGSTGMMVWTLDADQPVYGFLLGPMICGEVTVLEDMEAGPCLPAGMTLFGEPGETLWIWVGAQEYSPPPGFVGHQFLYNFTIAGLADGVVATEAMSFDRVKSLYR